MKTDGVFGGPITQALIQDPSLRVLWSRDRPASRKKSSKIRFRACLKSCPLILTPGKKTSYKTKRWLSAVTKSGWHWTQSIPTSSSSESISGVLLQCASPNIPLLSYRRKDINLNRFSACFNGVMRCSLVTSKAYVSHFPKSCGAMLGCSRFS